MWYYGYMKHIVLFSGGLGSYFTVKRLIAKDISKEDIILLFTDTKMEDEDLYRFLDAAEKYLGIEITRLADGRDIWQVFHDVKYLGNSRLDPCSRILKRELSRKFIHQFSPNECIIYLGFDWTEINRFEKARKAWLPYKIESPMCEPPYVDKEQMKLDIIKDGIELPRLYKMGFAHNNCGGGCVKAGKGHFAKLLDEMPERFAEWERHEKEMQEFLGKNVTILRKMKKGKNYRYSLSELRKDRQNLTDEELCDIGGCTCFQD